MFLSYLLELVCCITTKCTLFDEQQRQLLGQLDLGLENANKGRANRYKQGQTALTLKRATNMGNAS